MANATTPRLWGFELILEDDTPTYTLIATTISRTPDGDDLFTTVQNGLAVTDLSDQVATSASDHGDNLTTRGYTVTGSYPIP